MDLPSGRERNTDRHLANGMDTRSKILDSSKAIERLSGRDHASLLIARGSFDILRAEHCRRLAREKAKSEKLVVLVSNDISNNGANEAEDAGNPRPTVLDARTRAELVAALQVVDYVVICGEAEAQGLISALPSARLIEPDTPPLRDIKADVLRRAHSE